MCCSCQHLKPEPWGYSCRHCGAWLDIGRAPTVEEVAENCEPREQCGGSAAVTPRTGRAARGGTCPTRKVRLNAG